MQELWKTYFPYAQLYQNRALRLLKSFIIPRVKYIYYNSNILFRNNRKKEVLIFKREKSTFTKVIFSNYKRRAFTSKLYFILKEFKLIKFLFMFFLYYYSFYLYFPKLGLRLLLLLLFYLIFLLLPFSFSLANTLYLYLSYINIYYQVLYFPYIIFLYTKAYQSYLLYSLYYYSNYILSVTSEVYYSKNYYKNRILYYKVFKVIIKYIYKALKNFNKVILKFIATC